MITNKTKNKTISNTELICKTFLSQIRGLMFRKKQNLIIIFNEEKKVSLHMFFVFFPIDVLVLDKNKRIVEIKKNFKQFEVWNSTGRGKYVVELGIKDEYEIGDRIEFSV